MLGKEPKQDNYTTYSYVNKVSYLFMIFVFYQLFFIMQFFHVYDVLFRMKCKPSAYFITNIWYRYEHE